MDPTLLLQHRENFIAFVRSRLGDPSLAADLVQDCLVRALQAERHPLEETGVLPWFYRILRRAIIDAHRRQQTRERALQSLRAEPPAFHEATPGEHKALCQCVLPLIQQLPEDDAALLREVDMNGTAATAYARQRGQRVNTLNVRLHRARRRLRLQLEAVCQNCAAGETGCLDCDCGKGEGK